MSNNFVAAAATNNSSSSRSIPTPTLHLLGPWDVVMGRGSQATDNQGNRRLRQLVRDRCGVYQATRKQCKKQQIVDHILSIFHAHGGRFLREEVDASSGFNTWRVVRDSTVIFNKVKQMLRDVRPETAFNRKIRKRKGGSGESLVTTTRRKLNVLRCEPAFGDMSDDGHAHKQTAETENHNKDKRDPAKSQMSHTVFSEPYTALEPTKACSDSRSSVFPLVCKGETAPRPSALLLLANVSVSQAGCLQTDLQALVELRQQRHRFDCLSMQQAIMAQPNG